MRTHKPLLYVLLNLTSGLVLSTDARMANDLSSRLIGLLSRRKPDRAGAMLIPHCAAIHTFGMAFPIDAYALDNQYQVISAAQNVKPARVRFFGWKTRCILELPHVTDRRTMIEEGDRLSIRPFGALRF